MSTTPVTRACVDMVGGPFDGHHGHYDLPTPAFDPVWVIVLCGRTELLDAVSLGVYEALGSPVGEPIRYHKRCEEVRKPVARRPAMVRVVTYEIPALAVGSPTQELASAL